MILHVLLIKLKMKVVIFDKMSQSSEKLYIAGLCCHGYTHVFVSLFLSTAFLLCMSVYLYCEKKSCFTVPFKTLHIVK